MAEPMQAPSRKEKHDYKADLPRCRPPVVLSVELNSSVGKNRQADAGFGTYQPMDYNDVTDEPRLCRHQQTADLKRT